MLGTMRRRSVSICALLFAGLSASAAQSDQISDHSAEQSPPVASGRGHIAKPRLRRNPTTHKSTGPVYTAGPATKRPAGRSSTTQDEVNTWVIFGFTEGSDTGPKGERTVSHDSIIRAGGGTAWDGGTEVGYSVSDRAVVSLGTLTSLAQSSTEFERGLGVVAGFKYQFLRRGEAPVGLAVQVAPYAQRFEGSAGAHDTFGGEVRLILDRVLVPGQWFAALNLAYAPQRSAYTDGGVTRETTMEVSGAVARRLTGELFVGAEVRYLNKFQGYGVDLPAANALYLGPTMYLGLGQNGYFGAAWSIQVAGRSNIDTRPDLENFERHQFRLKAGFDF
jgi:hypothetical protein